MKNLILFLTRRDRVFVPRCLSLSAFILVVILLASCAPLRPELGPPVSSDFADNLLQKWRDKALSIDSIQGLARLKLEAPLNNITANQVLLVERPDRLRAETLSPFGVPLLLLVASGEKMGALLPSQNIYYQGSSSPQNLGMFVNLPLGLPELVGVLLYQPEMIDFWKKEAFTLKSGGWLLIHRGTVQRQELIFNDLQELIEVSYYKDNDLLLKVQYAEFSGSENSYPKLLTLKIPEKYATITLEFSDVETNAQIRPELFKIAPPASARVVYLPD